MSEMGPGIIRVGGNGPFRQGRSLFNGGFKFLQTLDGAPGQCQGIEAQSLSVARIEGYRLLQQFQGIRTALF